MLRQMRNVLKGVVAWFVILLLVAAFVLWGVPEFRSFTQSTPLKVGDVSFSREAILAEFNREMTSRRQDAGADYTREDAIADGLPDAVISTLATRSVIEQEAEKMALVMPTKAVAQALEKDERFHNPASGKFDEVVLRSILQNNSLTVRQFEAALKSDLLRGQIIEAMTAEAPPPDILVDALLLREIETRQVSYLVVTEEIAGPAAEPTPAELQAYYQENAALFTAPEYRTFSYVAIREADFRQGLSAPEEALRKAYDAGKAAYDIPEKRTIYQVTFDTEAEAKAASAALKEGAPFEKIAADRGLSLNAATFTEITRRDIVDPAVAEAAFAPNLAAGAVADPVKSLFGWTVVQVAGIVPPQTTTFEEARPELEAKLLEEDTRKRVFDAVEALEEARDTGANLAAAAQSAELQPVQVGPIDASGFAAGAATAVSIPAEILAAAFVVDEGEESEAMTFKDEEGYFFVQVETITPPTLRPYEEVAADVGQRWRAAERDRRVAAKVASIRQTIDGGQSLEQAAAGLNLSLRTATLRRETASDAFSASLSRDLYFVDKGAIVTGSALLGPEQIVARVDAVDFERARVTPESRIGYQQLIAYQIEQELLDAYVAELRQDYSVKQNAALVSQIFSEDQ